MDRAGVAQLPERLVFNCTGLGAKELFGDDSLYPVKGQLTYLLPQSEVNYAWVNGEAILYMFPRGDGIALGETHEQDVSSLEADAAQAKRIFDGVQALYAKMRG
jgi:hypothetical protein